MGANHDLTNRPGRDLALVTEVALAGTSVAAVLGMQPLFLGGSFRVSLLLQVVLAHVTIAVFRRANVSLPVAALATLITALIALTWSQYADTLWGLFPSLDTLATMQADMSHAWGVFREMRAPAPVEPGFVVAASLAIWVAVFTADWGAFRTGVSFESLLPSATLFLFAAVLGDPAAAGWGAPAYAATALLFLLLHRTWRQEGTIPWAGLQRWRGRRSLMSSGMVLSGVAVIVSGVIWPNLPGATDPPVLPWRQADEEDEVRRVVSPLVDIRGRMVDRSNLEMFTVETEGDTTGHYWRVTALDEFNGNIFLSSYKTDEATGPLPSSAESAAPTRQLEQKISISNLEAIWLPSAYEPVAFDGDEAVPVQYDQRSSTLIVDKSVESSDGMSYTVTSALPDFTAEELRQADGRVPEDIANRYLQLPSGFSKDVEAEAQRITQGADTAYDKALVLQNYLRTFEYTLDPPLPGDPGDNPDRERSRHSQDALSWFLFESQRGYCEQFAGAFAAMARSLGLPTRVAVGFTMGIQDPNEPTLFRVQGKHAHAWPEVYFEGYGWVLFEPTPGRGLPGGESWLGFGGEQVSGNGDGTSSTTVPPRPEDDAPETETPGGDREDTANTPAPSPPPTETPPTSEPGFFEDLVPPEVTAASRPVGLGVLGYLVVVPLGLLLQQYIRRRRARSPAQQVRLAWDEITEQAALLGVHMPLSMTVNERAGRLRATLPGSAPAIDQIATSIEINLYANGATTQQEAGWAQLASSSVRSEVAKRRPRYRRVLDHLDVRRLLPKNHPARRSVRGAHRLKQLEA